MYRQDNCIKSSTAIGFCLEEFIVNKLIDRTKNNILNEEIFIERNNTKGTQNSSYDFYCKYKNELFLINLKADKGSNNAIAAINQLYLDYVQNNQNYIKHFLILKLSYKIKESKIEINDIYSYFLEEVDFSKGYRSDSRNWSKKYNNNSGRLQITKKFFNENKTPIELISCDRTKEQIEKIYKNIIEKIEKNY
ncbi:MAG: hypothetical protein K2K73_02435 [Ureaplasma sp.]|nr:hypothetical protein [Ureaplasma sp.]